MGASIIIMNFFHCKTYTCCHFNDSEIRICLKIDGSTNEVAFFFSLSLSKSCFLASCAFYSWRHLGNKVINLYSVTDSDTLWHLTLNSRSLSFWGKSLLRENWGSGGKKTDTGSHSSCHPTIKMLTWIYLEKYRQFLSPQTSLLPPVFKYPPDTLQGAFT